VAMSNGTLKGTWAFLTGRLKVRGPQSVAKKLDEIFP
jgi:putative sterol carrier protein